MSSGIGIGISSVFGGPRGLPSDFSYGQKQFCDDDNATYTPTPKNTGGTWSISPALSGFNTSTGAFSPYGVTGTFVVSHTFDGKTSTQTIVLNDSDEIATFTYPNSAYPQSGVNPTPTITGTGPGINTGTFSATPAGLSFVDVSTGEIDLSESALNSYVITYTSGSEFCADTATFTLEVEDPYVGFKFRILVPAGADQTLALETVNGASAAPNSVINWGDGTGVQSLTTTTASNSFSTGTYDIEINAFDSTTPVNNFSVTSGEALVTQVLDWGGTPWYSLNNAFEDCVNLTTFGTGTFKGISTSTGVILDYCFKGCTSLALVDMTSWDLSEGMRAREMFSGCTNITKITWTGIVKLTNSIAGMFFNVGTAVTAGCNFQTNNLDFSSSTVVTIGGTTTQGNGMFTNALIDADNSDISNWDFRTSIDLLTMSMIHTFRNARVVGDDKTLNISNWKMACTNTISLNLMFDQFNEDPGDLRVDHNIALNMTDWEFGSGTTISNWGQTFRLANFRKIIGLNTWTSGVIARAEYMFQSTNFWAIQEGDNFSDAFWENSAITNGFVNMFSSHGLGLSESDWGESPNIKGLSKNPTTTGNQTIAQMFTNARYTTTLSFEDVDISTGYGAANGTPINYHINGIKIKKNGVVSGGVDYSNAKIKFIGGSFANWTNAEISFLTFGPDIDFTLMTNWTAAFNNSFPDWPLTFATNLNLTNLTTIGLSRTLTPCQADNFIRAVHDTNYLIGGPTPFAFSLGSSQVTNSPSVVNTKLLALEAAGYTITDGSPFTTMPFALSSYSLVTGSEATATIDPSSTGGTFTSSNTAIATVNASTGTVTTGADSGTCQIRYTLADGVCYNEVNLAVTIPLIANNFSFNFDGINDNLTMDPFDIPSPNSTLTMWFNSSDIGGPTGGNRVLTVLFSKQNRYFPYIDETAAGKIQIYVRDDAGSTITTTSVDFIANEWYHLAITQSSTGLFFYINGQKMNSTAGISRYPTALTRISGYPNNTYNLLGKIDEMAVWNTTLTDAQILDIYNGRLGVQNETVDLSKYANLGGNLVYWNRMGD